MKVEVFRGSATATITPFNVDGSINFATLDELVEFQIAGKVDAIVVCGTTGEASTLDIKEHISVVQKVVERVNKRVPVIAGTGSNNTRHAINLTQMARDVGADAVLSVAPYYNKPNQRGMIVHFSAIAEAVDIPIILYNIPSRTNVNMLPETIAQLAGSHENIVGIKECVTDQVRRTMELCGQDFSIYSGNDDTIKGTIEGGGKGLISTLGNIIPEYMHNLVQKYLSRDYHGAQVMQNEATELIKALFQPDEVNPGTTKALMNAVGMGVGQCRLPIVTPEGVNLKRLLDAAKAFGLKVQNQA